MSKKITLPLVPVRGTHTLWGYYLVPVGGACSLVTIGYDVSSPVAFTCRACVCLRRVCNSSKVSFSGFQVCVVFVKFIECGLFETKSKRVCSSAVRFIFKLNLNRNAPIMI